MMIYIYIYVQIKMTPQSTKIGIHKHYKLFKSKFIPCVYSAKYCLTGRFGRLLFKHLVKENLGNE